MSNAKLRERRSVKVTGFDKGLTEQHHKKSTSMNFILDRYRKTGLVEHANSMQGSYADYPDSVSLHEAMNIMASAASMFETIPSSIRKQFNNDPGQFLDFVQNESNYEQIKEMGISVDHLPEPVPKEAEPISAPLKDEAEPISAPLKDKAPQEPESTP